MSFTQTHADPIVPQVPRPLRAGTNPLLLAYRFARNPAAIWADFQFEVARQHFSYFGKRVVLLNSPDDIHAVFTGNSAALELEPSRQKVMRPVFGDGALSAEGALWKESRRICAQTLASVPLERIAATSAAEAEAALAALPGPQATAAELADRITTAVTFDTLFGGELMSFADDYLQARDAYLQTSPGHILGDLLSVPEWVPWPGRAGARRQAREIRQFARELAAAAAPLKDSAFAGMVQAHRDAGLPEEMVIDNTLTLIAGSQESIGRSTAWAMFLLARDRQAQARAREEIDAAGLDGVAPVDWPAALPFVAACYSEALRLYPPLSVLSRIATADIALDDGDVIRDGTIVLLNLWTLHRHRNHWADPGAFLPERFLPENADTIPKRAYLPFGTGSRACIGGRVASVQGVAMLAAMLRGWDLRYAAERDPQPIMRITMIADNGVPLEIVPR